MAEKILNLSASIALLRLTIILGPVNEDKTQ